MTQTGDSSSTEPQTVWSPRDLCENPHEAPDKAVRVQRMFASIAGRYDLNNRIHSLGLDLVWRKRAARLARVRPTDDVLDIACGTGDLTMALARAKPRRIVGVDFTEEMLEIAREKSQRLKSNATIPQYLQGDALALPFDAQSFDIVSIAFGIRNVADPAQAIREFHRVLRPGGRLVILEFTQPRNPIARWLNDVYTKRIMPATATLIAQDDSGAYHYLPKSVETFLDAEAMSRLLLENRFTSPQVHPQTFGACTIYMCQPLAE